MVTDQQAARAQWLAQVAVIRRNERRLQKALPGVYDAAIARWELTGSVVIPQPEQVKLSAAMVRMWREATAAGMTFPAMSEKAMFAHLETKEVELTLFERILMDFLTRFGALKVQRIIETTRAQIVKVTSAGVAEGLGVEAIAKRMRDAVPAISRTRARVIARTEVHTAAMHSQIETVKSIAAPMNKKWVSAYDSRTRDFGEADGVVDEFNHRAMNDVVVGPDQFFEVPGKGGVFELMSGPGDPNGSAANTINCRCALTFRRVGRA